MRESVCASVVLLQVLACLAINGSCLLAVAWCCHAVHASVCASGVELLVCARGQTYAGSRAPSIAAFVQPLLCCVSSPWHWLVLLFSCQPANY